MRKSNSNSRTSIPSPSNDPMLLEKIYDLEHSITLKDQELLKINSKLN